MKLNVKALGLASGIIWGAGIFFMTWWLILLDPDSGAGLLERVYRGYDISPLGSVIGLVWGFFDALIGGLIFAWLYNKLASGSEGS